MTLESLRDQREVCLMCESVFTCPSSFLDPLTPSVDARWSGHELDRCRHRSPNLDQAGVCASQSSRNIDARTDVGVISSVVGGRGVRFACGRIGRGTEDEWSSVCSADLTLVELVVGQLSGRR